MTPSALAAEPAQREVVTPGPLLAPDGTIAAPGFSRRPVLEYNPERIGLTPLRFLNRLRLKEWDFYATVTPDLALSVAVAHGGVAGVVAAQVTDFRTRTALDAAAITPFGRGCALPRSSDAGDVRFERRGGPRVEFRKLNGRREIRIDWPRFAGARALAADLAVAEPPGTESIVVATPIGARGFYYNRKTPGLPTEGRIALGDERHDLGPAGRALTTLDWGRGVWPYATYWIWAAGAGYLPDGRRLGLNLGAGFGDLSAATENALFLDGRLHKLGRVDFEFDRADPTRAPWRFRSPDGRVDLELPADRFVLDKRLDALVIRSRLRQITGTVRGRLVADSGERIDVPEAANVIVWAEVHEARW